MKEKIKQAQKIIAEAFEKNYKSIVCWTGGKDSTLLLWIMIRFCEEKGVSSPEIVFIDDGDVFPEIWDFINSTSKEWDLNVTIIKNQDILQHVKEIGDRVEVNKLNRENQNELRKIGFSEEVFIYEPESYAGNHLLKTVPLNQHIVQNGIEAVFTAIRRDEHPARKEELFFSKREDPPHIRVHPILDFTERDVWDTIFEYKIPFCSLYEKGYRSIGARYNTRPTDSKPAWLQDFDLIPERAGRGQNKEQIMDKLRALGYM